MLTLIPALLFYYNAISLGDTSTTTIHDYIVVEALVAGVNPQMLSKIAEKESRFNCKAVGDNGTSFGCFQIHNPESKKVRPLTKAQAHDIFVSTSWAIQTIKEDGDCHQWSTCKSVMKEISIRND